MNKQKMIIKHIKMFFLSILVFITTITVLLRLTIFNKSFVALQFNEEHYQKVELNLKTEMKESMISSGLDNTIIDTMFTTADIKNTTNQTLDIVYNYHNQKLNTSKIQKKLEENIDENLKKQNYQIQDKKGYDEFVESTMKIYQNEFTMLKQLEKVGKYMSLCIRVSTVLSLLLSTSLILLILLRRKTIKRIMPVALFVTSILILFGIYYINKTAELTSITILSKTFSDVLRIIIRKTFKYFQVIAIIYMVLAIVMHLFFIEKRRRHHHHHH